MGAQRFRADIEGLRGVCVLAVVGFHAFPAVLIGGYTGVDVFFVISGFLITQLMLREHEATGRIDLAAFWARRVRRILPAATTVLLVTGAVALLLPLIDARALGRQMVGAALFYFNWQQAAAAVEYLAADAHRNPLLHYWSLSVEEQFYLLWPAVLTGMLLLLRGFEPLHRRRQILMTGTGALAALSLALCIGLTPGNGPFAFFGTMTRAWQLLSGALLAIYLTSAPAIETKWTNPLGLIAAAALLACFLLISQSASYPGTLALAPTLATVALLYSGASADGVVARTLGTSLLQRAGRISFSLYLWHWPVLVYAKVHYGTSPGVIWAAIALSIALAALTYVLIEAPLRVSPRLTASSRASALFGVALIAASVGAGIALTRFSKVPVPMGNGLTVDRRSIDRDRPIIYRDGCLVRFDGTKSETCAYGVAASAKTVMLFGDSHAGNWFVPLEAAAKSRGWRLLVRIKASCSPLDADAFHLDKRLYPECRTWRTGVLQEIESLRPDLVVIGSISHALTAAEEQRIFNRIAPISPMVVLRDTPYLPEMTSTCLIRNGGPKGCAWPLQSVMQTDPYPKTPASALPPGTRLIDLNDRVCPGGQCSSVVANKPVMFDDQHLTAGFSATFTDVFVRLLDETPPKASRP